MIGRRIRPERRKSRATQTFYLTWSSNSTATDYLLQVGQSTTTWERFNSTVGDVLTYALDLELGTYTARVTPSTVGKVSVTVT